MGRKVFKFAIEIDGIDQLLFQEVKKPKVELGSVVHGGANGKEVKTAGGYKVGEAELQKIKPAGESDRWAWDKLQQASNGLPEDYKFDCVFKELSTDGITTLNRWLWIGCWVKSADDGSYKRGAQDENVMETAVLCVDDVILIE